MFTDLTKKQYTTVYLAMCRTPELTPKVVEILNAKAAAHLMICPVCGMDNFKHAMGCELAEDIKQVAPVEEVAPAVEPFTCSCGLVVELPAGAARVCPVCFEEEA